MADCELKVYETPVLVEAECAEGLENITRDEVRRLFPQTIKIERVTSGAVTFSYRGALADLRRLRTATSVYTIQRYAVPRPKALLGHQHLTALLAQLNSSMVTREDFQTFFLSAAGDGSAVLQRLKSEITQHTKLTAADEKGDLLIRLRRHADGWETLARITARPLATRRWRVCNYEGALNAAVARAMIQLTDPQEDQRVLNLCCGSGTLLIERVSAGPVAQIVGVDRLPSALECAQTNITAARLRNPITLVQGDATRLDMPDACMDVVLADLPFGQLVGTHSDNQTLYPRLLAEAARVAVPNAYLVLLSHEIRLMEQLMTEMHGWTLQTLLKITLNGLHPRIYVLRRQS
jgi:tRNA (guanine6-N2)-methyltransferase